MNIVSFRSFEKNTLRGFFTVILSNGLEIRDLCLHSKNGKSWIQMPSKPYEDEHGNKKWSYIVHFPNKDISNIFQKQVIEALKKFRKTEEANQTE